jgi:hypothetical protein
VKLAIKQYLASLRERDELDVIMPDLLSQMGLTVFSRPSRGTRQYGVDIAAVGCMNGEAEKVYLVSIKSGDLTRATWEGTSHQSLRNSLEEIRDAYIKNNLPVEHRDKQIVICLCFGGDVNENVRSLLSGYTERNTTPSISYIEWNGDVLAELVQSHLLREDLFPNELKPLLRKSLALLDEPEVSFSFFKQIINCLYEKTKSDSSQRLISLRQLNICLWILYTWARDAGNLEAAYLSSELTLLHAWEISKASFENETKYDILIQRSFASICSTYSTISQNFLEKLLPHFPKPDGISVAVQSQSEVDVNLKLFDLLGRVSIIGLWHLMLQRAVDPDSAETQKKTVNHLIRAVQLLVQNNPALLLPLKDDQAIDVFLAMLLMSYDEANSTFMQSWLTEMIEQTTISHQLDLPYPCTINNYKDLLEHPKNSLPDYKEEVTAASILYPTMALWAALLSDETGFRKLATLKRDHLAHCNFQFWFPDESTEEYFYNYRGNHGATLSGIQLEGGSTSLKDLVWKECDQSRSFHQLSAIRLGLPILVLIACRHYRMPIPLHFVLGYRDQSSSAVTQEEEV